MVTAVAAALCRLLLSAALVLVSGVHAGLYLLVRPSWSLTGGVISAWLLLTKINQ